jgi:acyl-[acyl-carrier-protein]-phospholipid O-acyltransferase/long-chain-fatty-acid--[acyl-carrier-protein] ligase
MAGEWLADGLAVPKGPAGKHGAGIWEDLVAPNGQPDVRQRPASAGGWCRGEPTHRQPASAGARLTRFAQPDKVPEFVHALVYLALHLGIPAVSFSLLALCGRSLLGQLPGGVDAGVAVLVLVVGAVVVFLFLCWCWPGRMLRLPLWLCTHTMYRLRVLGRENIPAAGGALLVCNHVSYIDWLLILAAQKRFIRFVVFAAWTRQWGIRHLLRWARVIPIDAWSGPRAIVKSLRAASEALKQGDLVCIFAEGRLTRTGFLLPFHRGFEQIVKHHPVPIIPVCLDQVWGSVFSFHGGKLFWKWPQEIPYPAWVAFGKPLPATAEAAEVRLAIQKLSADCAIARSHERRSVHRQFVRMASRHPFRPCLIDTTGKGQTLRYGKVLAGAMCLAQKLRPLLGAEKMVGLWLPPAVGAAIANIALALLRKTAVNLNYTTSPEAIQSAIQQCGIRHVLTSKRFTARVNLDAGPGVELIYLEEIAQQITSGQKLRAFLKVLLLPGFVLERWGLGLGEHRLDDLATVIFSSGSTGEPKGIMLSHRNIAANAESMVQAIDLRPSDRILGILPFFHSFGYTVTLWAPLQVGASTLYHADPRQAKEIGELCRKHQATIFLITPTFLRFCLKRSAPGDFASLRILITGAEKLPQPLAQDFHKKFGVLPLEGYGCTELSPAAAANVPDVDIDGFKQVGNKPGTIGQPLPGVAAQVVHPDTFEPLPAGEEGLLLIYGANVMEGYLNRPEQTREVIRDGWYVTGDLAKIDEDGFITITGRLSRFAKVGGEMVPLEKIEDQLHDILQTSERICAVTCVPDEARGERLVVLHTELNGTDSHHLCEQLSHRGLPNLWIPAERDFLQVPELPLLGSGKLHLQQLKQMALERTQQPSVVRSP